jgi:hypothetical protein
LIFSSHRNMLTTTKQPSMPQVWRFDWDGLEDKKAEVHNLAVQIQLHTNELEVECDENGWDAAGAVGCAVQNPDAAECIFSPYVIFRGLWFTLHSYAPILSFLIHTQVGGSCWKTTTKSTRTQHDPHL